MKTINLILFSLTLVTNAIANEGGIGNGTDLYRCETEKGTTYELLDIYEARLRKQEVVFYGRNKTAEAVLKEMTRRLSQYDLRTAVLVFAEGSKVLSDIRALMAHNVLVDPVVMASNGALAPGEDAGRITHPENCVPMRLIKQYPNPALSGIRYEVDLDLLKNINDVSLGISAFHEGLYKLVLANHINSSVGVRKISALVFFDSLNRITSFQEYLRELSAAGFTDYSYGPYLIPIQSIVEIHGNRYHGDLKEPVSAFGIDFRSISFGLESPLESATLVASLPPSILEAVPGTKPQFKLKRKGTVSVVEWNRKFKLNSTSSLTVTTHDSSLIHSGNQFQLDSQDRITTQYVNIDLISKKTKKNIARYFACWRNRLLHEKVTSSDLFSFDASYARLVSKRELDEEVLDRELNECLSSEYSKARAKYTREQSKALSLEFDRVESNLSAGRSIIKMLAEQFERCDVHSITALAGLGAGISLTAGYYVCKDFAGYTRTFIGVNPSINLAFGVGFKSEHIDFIKSSKGTNARFKFLHDMDSASEQDLWGTRFFSVDKSPVVIPISEHGMGAYAMLVNPVDLFGVRVKSRHQEELWLETFVRDLNLR